jgi:hypothetical protein
MLKDSRRELDRELIYLVSCNGDVYTLVVASPRGMIPPTVGFRFTRNDFVNLFTLQHTKSRVNHMHGSRGSMVIDSITSPLFPKAG